MSKVAFVAGATGAAAKRLIEELGRQNWRVVGVSRYPPRDKVGGKVTYVSADLMDASGIKRVLSSYRDITHLFFTARIT